MTSFDAFYEFTETGLDAYNRVFTGQLDASAIDLKDGDLVSRIAGTDLHVEMIDCHDGAIIYTGRPTSERRISAPSLNKISGRTGASPSVLATLLRSTRRPAILTASTGYGGRNA